MVKSLRGSLSISLRLALGITALALVITVSLTAWLLTGQLRAADQALERKTVAYGRLASSQLEPAVAFDDTETAREVFQALQLDREVVGVALYGKDGSLLASGGDSRADLGEVSGRSATIRRTAERMILVAPVSPREGGRGFVVLEVSVASLAQARAEMIRAGGAVALGGLLLGLAGALVIGRSLRRRLARLSDAAAAVSHGDLSGKPVRDAARDEIGRLGEAFDIMLERLNAMIAENAARAAEEQRRLDELVQQRTKELDERNRGMRFLLDHLDQGVVSVDSAGTLGDEHSRAVVEWFGPPVSGDALWQYLAGVSIAPSLEASWGAVTDGFLPLELALDQLPKRFVSGDRTFEMVVSPVDGGRFIVFFSDVTAEVEQARAAAGQRELAVAFSCLAKDQSGFLAQMSEADQLVHRIVAASSVDAQLKRDLHTLKGNAAMLGFATLADRCHHLENILAETGDIPGRSEAEALGDAWRAVWTPVEALCADRAAMLSIDRGELSYVRRAVESGQPRARILEAIRGLAYEAAHKRLAWLADWAKGAAERQGKPDLEVSIDDGGVRFDEEIWEPFWSSCIHLVRNAVAHGIEAPDDREAAGKSAAGRLAIRVAVTGDRLVVAVRDDGRGVDWGAVRVRAARYGLPLRTQEELTDALFHRGLTTRREADELSGRGEGLGAVREAVRALGGNVVVASEKGQGTELRVVFSLAAVQETLSVRRGEQAMQEKVA